MSTAPWENITDGTGLEALTTSGLQGALVATRRELESIFGQPGFDDPLGEYMGDSTVEWTIRFDDGTMATIYDIDIIDEDTNDVVTPEMDVKHEWHVGGNSARAAGLVEAVVAEHREKA